MTPDTTSTPRGLLLRGEDLSRTLVFSGFWGSIFFLLAFVSQVLTFRRRPAEVHSPTVLTGAGIFIGGFVGLGTLLIAIATARSGKKPAEQAREQIGAAGETSSGSVLRTALSAATGSLLPLALSRGSLRLAAQLTGTPALTPTEGLSLPRTAVVNALLNALIAAAVARITGWVARDARNAERTRSVQE